MGDFLAGLLIFWLHPLGAIVWSLGCFVAMTIVAEYFEWRATKGGSEK